MLGCYKNGSVMVTVYYKKWMKAVMEVDTNVLSSVTNYYVHVKLDSTYVPLHTICSGVLAGGSVDSAVSSMLVIGSCAVVVCPVAVTGSPVEVAACDVGMGATEVAVCPLDATVCPMDVAIWPTGDACRLADVALCSLAFAISWIS